MSTLTIKTNNQPRHLMKFKKGEDVWAPHSEKSANIFHHGTILQIKGPKALVHFEAWKSFPQLEPELTVKLPLSMLRKYPQ